MHVLASPDRLALHDQGAIVHAQLVAVHAAYIGQYSTVGRKAIKTKVKWIHPGSTQTSVFNDNGKHLTAMPKYCQKLLLSRLMLLAFRGMFVLR